MEHKHVEVEGMVQALIGEIGSYSTRDELAPIFRAQIEALVSTVREEERAKWERMEWWLRKYFEDEDSCCPSCSQWPHHELCSVKFALEGKPYPALVSPQPKEEQGG